MDARVGFAEFDAQAEPYGVHVGWAVFDVQDSGAPPEPYGVCVAWAEFDVRSPSADPVPPYRPGGGVSRYHSAAKQNYEVVVAAVDEAEEEDIVLRILMEIAKNEL